MHALTSVSEIEVTYKPLTGTSSILITADDAAAVLKPFFPEESICLQERFVVGYLNRACGLVGIYHLSTGGITATVADIRLILGVALKVAATGLILAHNHPSGSLEFSAADKDLTCKIKEAARYFDIKVLDHLIITAGGKFRSMADYGLL